MLDTKILIQLYYRIPINILRQYNNIYYSLFIKLNIFFIIIDHEARKLWPLAFLFLFVGDEIVG